CGSSCRSWRSPSRSSRWGSTWSSTRCCTSATSRTSCWACGRRTRFWRRSSSARWAPATCPASACCGASGAGPKGPVETSAALRRARRGGFLRRAEQPRVAQHEDEDCHGHEAVHDEHAALALLGELVHLRLALGTARLVAERDGARADDAVAVVGDLDRHLAASGDEGAVEVRAPQERALQRLEVAPVDDRALDAAARDHLGAQRVDDARA